MHQSLPKMAPEELAYWLKKNAVEQFTDIKKYYFTEEEIATMEHESSVCGREILKLEALLSNVRKFVKKGVSDDDITLDIPETIGMDALKEQRKDLDLKLERGYSQEEVEVFGVPDLDGFMYYFDVTGEEMAERKRGLSSTEQRKYNGLFLSHKKAQ